MSRLYTPDARVVKLVDTQDLKSCDLTVVPVRFRLRAPSFLSINQKLKENLSNPSTASLGFIN